MGRPPSNGGPAFRFNPSEVAEMEAILQAHNAQVPAREILVSLAEKFSNSTDRSGKVAVQMKQVWNWFQNRRYALRAKAAKAPAKLSASPAIANDLAAVRNVPQAPQHVPVPPVSAIVRNVSQVPQAISSTSVQSSGQNGSDNFMMEFEAKSARDGAWYDVATFISHRSVETSDPEVLVRFAGLGPEEDEWVNVRKHVRQRSLPCEATECVVVNQSDLILCFQEGKEQALYFDAHVLDAQRRRHDVRGCRCRFLVRYDHDLSEEIVPLKKVCRRPETDYRLRQLHAESANMNQSKTVPMPHTGNVVIYPSSEAIQKQQKAEAPGETKEEPPKVDMLANIRPVQAPVTQTNASTTTASLADAVTCVNAAVVAPALAVQPITPVATTPPISLSNVSGVSLSPASTTNSAIQPTDSGATISRVTSTVTVANPITSGATFSAASTTNPADQFIGSGTTASSGTATPVTHLVTPGATASTFQDANSHISGSAVSAVTTTPFSNLSVAGAMATTPPVANLTTITTAVANSTFTGAVTTTTPHSNSIVTGAVTTTIPVANSTGAAATDSLVTITTPSSNSNLAGVTDSMVTTTASTANSDVSGVAESVGIASDVSGVTESIGIATTLVVAESSVPEVPDSVASEEV